jgi:predicted transcriptional regulator
MTRKNRTVNPGAGTLKQENRALRTSIKSMTVKLIAFALFILVSIPNMSFVQDDTFTATVVSKKPLKEMIDHTDSCCVIEKPGTKTRKGTVKLIIPSLEMIRKSDSEANSNLAISITENKLKALKQWIENSDAEINNLFRKETTLSVAGILHIQHADTRIIQQFDAENISVSSVSITQQADKDMNHLFQAEQVGITTKYTNVDLADKEMNFDFVKNELTISLPSAHDFNLADNEMRNQIQQILETLPGSIVKSGEKK